MGSYNTSYENYYSNLKSARGTGGKHPVISKNKNKKNLSSFIIQRVIQELLGVLILFVFVLTVKSLQHPVAEKIYTRSRELVSKSYDISKVWKELKGIEINALTSSTEEYIDELIAETLGRKTTKERVESTFVIPVSGEVYKAFGDAKEAFSEKTKNGVIYTFKVPGDVVSSYNGIVKKIGEDEDLGQYVAIDHEGGIETKYFYLEEVSVVLGQKLKQGEKIGRIISGDEENNGYLFFQILFTGEEKNPQEYIRLKQETL
ncbi:peptidoglycan DD-metalloendopeptidase family protein [Alloiococcus sp. CFN-8]|uniref:peptidoglycan DD-metalloendopeptidase family protein n=1 Tax=Alloiococcus sp. CFN-8 TaxID=3416081 RepID=UPI003CECB396